ncbi:MAG: SoxR reducing system RseC family protein [Bacteroidales bacterium]|nr:SoxR reducing system RseC family protein [Bacteroidales bacterium]
MKENEVSHEGIVQKTENRQITVKITQKSACSACHAKGMCGMADHKEKVVVALAPAGSEFQVGEKVVVTLRQSLAAKAVVLCYLIPFVILFTTFCIMSALCSIGWLNVLVALVATAIYFFLLWLSRNKIEKEFTFMVQKITENPCPSLSEDTL